VEVAESDVLAAKVIPPRTVTRRAVRELEAAAAGGWRGTDTERIGGWLLRAAGGFTGRANSCLPLEDAGMPIDTVIDLVEKWYRERKLVPAFQIPVPLGAGLEAALDRRGWPPAGEDVLVMSAELSAVGRRPRDDLPPVELASEPDENWLAAYHYRGGTLPANARTVLVNAEIVTFASVVVDGRPIAIARGAVSESPSGRRWLGVTAVEVDPAMRRRGLASHVMVRLADWARGHGGTDGYIQVAEGNAAAIATYRRLGFTEHHRYRYRRRP
jgi:GNAT superfamily N-acetyltransferase